MEQKKVWALELTTSCENEELVAYKDTRGIWTIAIGLARHYLDGTPIQEGDTCTHEQAQEWLEQYMEKNVYPVVDSFQRTYAFNDRIYAALCSFVYNEGASELKASSSIRMALQQSSLIGLQVAFRKFIYQTIDGQLKPCEGLKNRREKEITFFMKGT